MFDRTYNSSADTSSTAHTSSTENADTRARGRTGAYRQAVSRKNFPWRMFIDACLAAALPLGSTRWA